MAWGDGKPEGNGGNSCPQASHPPTPLALGRSTSLCGRTRAEGSSSVEWPHSHLSAGKSSVQHPPYLFGAVMLTGHNPCAEILAGVLPAAFFEAAGSQGVVFGLHHDDSVSALFFGAIQGL